MRSIASCRAPALRKAKASVIAAPCHTTRRDLRSGPIVQTGKRSCDHTHYPAGGNIVPEPHVIRGELADTGRKRLATAKDCCGTILIRHHAKHSTWIEPKNTFAGLTRVWLPSPRHACSFPFAPCLNRFVVDHARWAPIEARILSYVRICGIVGREGQSPPINWATVYQNEQANPLS